MIAVPSIKFGCCAIVGQFFATHSANKNIHSKDGCRWEKLSAITTKFDENYANTHYVYIFIYFFLSEGCLLELALLLVGGRSTEFKWIKIDKTHRKWRPKFMGIFQLTVLNIY
jgi:hypothetical protein